MHRAYLLMVTAVGEAGTGLLLLVWPAGGLALLLGTESASPETLFVTRFAGVPLITIGVACWLGRNGDAGKALVGLLVGVLFYDCAAAGLLAYAGLVMRWAGLALWPAVVLHAALGIWSAVCLSGNQRAAEPALVTRTQ